MEEEEEEAPKPRFGLGAGTRKVSSSQQAAKPDKRAARAARTAPQQVPKPFSQSTLCVAECDV